MSASGGDRAALDRLLGGPEAAWLVERVRARIPAARGVPMAGVVQLRAPTLEQRTAVVRLTGPAPRAGQALRVDLAVVEEMLRRGPWPAGLADAVEALTGPVVDLAVERQRTSAGWEAARLLLADAAAPYPGLVDWWDGWCASGGLKRAARAEADRTNQEGGPIVAAELVRQVRVVLAALPAAGEPLAMLARRTVGEAHGLDGARPLGRLATAVVGAAFASDRHLSVRDAWAAAGVVVSNLASTVLCLGVPGHTAADGDARAAATSAALEAMRVARMPLVLTLDQVRSGGVGALPPGTAVFGCENPTVVEVVADRWAGLAPDGPALVLVCTGGQPSTAVVELLAKLTADGAPCHYHGDFDWAGLRIARTLGQRISWTPWRYTAADYVAATAGARSRVLTGSPAESPWDPELAAAMTARGLAIEEEAVAEALAGELMTRTGPTVP